MGELSPWHWAIVIIVLVALFGARRLPDAARSIGRSARILKSELRAPDPESPPPAPAPTTPAPPTPAPPTQAEPTPAASTPAATAASAEAPPTTPRVSESEGPGADSTITTSQSPPRHN
jgi:sec-independent protein translocase protein TatA